METAKKAGLMVVLILIMGILTSCSDSSPLKIGFIGSLSGRYSELGVTARNTLQLMTDEINVAGGVNGRTIELIPTDDGGKPEEISAAFDRLFKEDVQFVIGPITSNMAEATVETVMGKDVLVMSPTMSTDYLSGRDDNILRVSGSNIGQAQLISEHLQANGKTSISVVYDLGNKKYTEGLFQGLKGFAKDNNFEIASVHPYKSGPANNFQQLAQEIEMHSPDAVVCIMSGLDGGGLAQQIRKINKTVTLYGTSWTQSNDLLVHGGRTVEGMFLIALHTYDEIDPAIAVLEEKYQKRFNEEPSFIITRVSDAYSIMIYGLTKAEKATPENVKAAILKESAFKGLGRPITIDKFGDSQTRIKLVVVENGTFRDAGS